MILIEIVRTNLGANKPDARPYEGCQAGRGFWAWCFSLSLGRARRSGREAESRAVALRLMNRSDSELASRLFDSVSFF